MWESPNFLFEVPLGHEIEVWDPRAWDHTQFSGSRQTVGWHGACQSWKSPRVASEQGKRDGQAERQLCVAAGWSIPKTYKIFEGWVSRNFSLAQRSQAWVHLFPLFFFPVRLYVFLWGWWPGPQSPFLGQVRANKAPSLHRSREASPSLCTGCQVLLEAFTQHCKSPPSSRGKAPAHATILPLLGGLSYSLGKLVFPNSCPSPPHPAVPPRGHAVS